MTDRHQSNLEQLSAHLRESDAAHQTRAPQMPRGSQADLSNAAYVAAVSQYLERLRRQPQGTSRRHI